MEDLGAVQAKDLLGNGDDREAFKVDDDRDVFAEDEVVEVLEEDAVDVHLAYLDATLSETVGWKGMLVGGVKDRNGVLVLSLEEKLGHWHWWKHRRA